MATKKTTKKTAKGGATKPSMLNRIYTTFDQVTDAYNEVEGLEARRGGMLL